MSRPVCTCDESSWLAQCFIGDELVDEALIDSSLKRAGDIVKDVRDRHDALTDEAVEQGKPWRVDIYCPACKQGMRVDSRTGPEMLS